AETRSKKPSAESHEQPGGSLPDSAIECGRIVLRRARGAVRSKSTRAAVRGSETSVGLVDEGDTGSANFWTHGRLRVCERTLGVDRACWRAVFDLCLLEGGVRFVRRAA